MSAKQHISDSIRAIARGLGRAPTRSQFIALAGISEYFVTQCFSSWNDAVRSAGLQANTMNVRLEDSELLEDWGETVRTNRAIPARRAYRRHGRYDPRTLERRFGPWSSLPDVFLNFAKTSRNGRMSWRFYPLAHQITSTNRTAPRLSQSSRRRHG